MKKLLILVSLFMFMLGCVDLDIGKFNLDFLKDFSGVVDSSNNNSVSPQSASQCISRDPAVKYSVFPEGKNELKKHIEEAIKQHGPTVDLSYIATCEIDDMSYLFYKLPNFNGNISNWDVSKVANMQNMFKGVTAFNQDISSWDVLNVKYMSSMFQGATSFNQDISNWDVSGVISMHSMFHNAKSFDNGGKVLTWGQKIRNVDDMSSMFQGATSFNQNISNWDVSKVTKMKLMFYSASSFSQNLSNWDVSSAAANQSLKNMFYGTPIARSSYPTWCKPNVCQ